MNLVFNLLETLRRQKNLHQIQNRLWKYIFGNTALILASRNGNTEIVKGLLNKGANPNIPNTSREKFTEIVLYICNNFNISSENKKCLLKVLEDINKQIQQMVISNNLKKLNPKITEKSLKKCNDTGLYLFLAKQEKLLVLINEYKLTY